jgi:predicted MFS family arabinose efflux permease
MLLSVGIAAVGGRSIVLVLFAVLLIDIAIQGTKVLSQTRLLSIEPESGSRLNTAFIVCNFTGGAIGSTAAGALWQHGGWSCVMGGAALVSVVSLTCGVLGRRTLLAAMPQTGAAKSP